MDGVILPMPEWRCWSLYQAKNCWQKARASWMQPKRSGNSGRYFMVRKWLSNTGCHRKRMGLDDAKIGHEKSQRLRRDDLATAGMDVELAGRTLVLEDGLFNESLGQLGLFPVCDHPPGDKRLKTSIMT